MMKLPGFRNKLAARAPLPKASGDKAQARALAAEADAARDRRDWAAAARLYRASLDADPAPAGLWVQFGHALKESGELDDAGRAYDAALLRAPDVADTHLQLGHLRKRQDRRDEAVAAYARAVTHDPHHPDALDELRALLRRGARLDDALAAEVSEALRQAAPVSAPMEEDDGRLTVVFDVSDLAGYFREARLPTGIQRVQIEVICALLRDPPAQVRVMVAAFTEARDGWVRLHEDEFLQLADLARADGARDAPDWLRARGRLALHLELAPALAFPVGAWLVNLGTSWWLQNYFLRLREARRRYGVRYLPFVHDMIPVMAPEHCTRALTQDFISWALGVFSHADAYLTNSQASRRDLVTVARRLNHVLDEDRAAVIPLDADFRPQGLVEQTPIDQTLGRYGLKADAYVLFVSTIESRKNHLAALRAWSVLIARHGPDAVPDLVCVGNRGWLNDAVFARLESDLVLRRKVRMLSGVSDPDLANLYRASAFTLYPSQYEGWGLPVTESLSHGKAVLASDSSSIPEAGGDLAVYFRDGDQPGLTAALERMIFDVEERRRREARIAAEFRPRPWRALADQLIDQVVGWRDLPRLSSAPPEIRPGGWYGLGRSRAVSIPPLTLPAEAFRAGDGWAAPEDWGCRVRGGEARLHGGTAAIAGRAARLWLGLRGAPDRAVAWRLETPEGLVGEGRLEAGETAWVVRSLDARARPGERMDLRLSAVRLARETPGDEDAPPEALSDRPSGAAALLVGVTGFILCAEDDVDARLLIQEAVSSGDLSPLAANPDAGI